MASNPDYPEVNRNLSPDAMRKRGFDNTNDAYRTTIVEGVDISIGAVEIKDNDSDVRVDVIDTGSSNAIVVIDSSQVNKSTVNIFGSAIISPGSTVTLATYTVPALKSFTWKGGIIGGNEVGEFTFYIGGTPQALVRNSGSVRTIITRFVEDLRASAGSVIEIKAKNIGHRNQSFEASLMGSTINV